MKKNCIIDNKLIERRLRKYGFYQDKVTLRLCNNKYKPIQFVIVVDDFGIKYTNK